MRVLYHFFGGLLILVILLIPFRQQSLQAQPLLEKALAELYADCLFESVASNPFSDAVTLARQTFAPGISGFIESNLAAIPMTPPSLKAEFTDDGIISVVTGFSPIYTESSSTVGQGLFLVGTNISYFNLSKIRGEDLNDLSFIFQQNNGTDQIAVNMPMNVSATVFTLHGTYGISDRFDIGFALPIVSLEIDNVNTTFTVQGDNTGCRYHPDGLNCRGVGNQTATPPLFSRVNEKPSSRETFLETLALRTKYRFPLSLNTVRLAAVMDIRLPLRTSDNMLGSGNFGTRFTIISEYNQLSTFQPYINVGAQFWNGASSNSLNVGTGFNQQLASSLFFSFDLLGKIDLEPDPFLAPIGGALSPSGISDEDKLINSSIPPIDRDHTLNAGLGFQFAFSPRFHAYGSVLFSLLDHGLQSTFVPTGGITAYF